MVHCLGLLLQFLKTGYAARDHDVYFLFSYLESLNVHSRVRHRSVVTRSETLPPVINCCISPHPRDDALKVEKKIIMIMISVFYYFNIHVRI